MHDLLVPVSLDTHDVVLDLVYASANNIAGRAIYERHLCLLHRDAEPCLRKAVRLAAELGLRLKIFDAFRPQEAQHVLWHAAPDKAYVADPQIGSNHTRGTAIDLTLVDAEGHDLDMGTAFDDMSALSHHGCDKVSETAQANRRLLLTLMETSGFEHLSNEWWHYALPDHEQYDLIDGRLPDHLNPMRPD